MKEITLPDSGVTLKIDRVPPFLLSDIRAEVLARIPKPKPPVFDVLLGADGIKTKEENKADPDYQIELQQYRIAQGRAFIEALVEVSTSCEVDTERVKRIRAWAGDNNALPKSDVVLYVTRVALETAADVEFFKNAVQGLSQPTEKGIEQSLNNFRPPQRCWRQYPPPTRGKVYLSIAYPGVAYSIAVSLNGD